MEKETFRKTAYDMIRLVRCVLHGETPDKDWAQSLDFPALYEVCQKHILTACAAYALESAGIQNNDFTQAKAKAIRKNILLDSERAKILKRLEQEHIWYMPLKGALLHNWYPRLGMRQMSDNDILCDGGYRAHIKDIMTDMGFKTEHYGTGNDDSYSKPPVSNFEMHNELFHVAQVGKLHAYYENVKERLLKDEGNDYGYHFSNEDYYIYLIAHEYAHYNRGGTGVRSLVDTYIYMRKFSDVLDWDYLNAEFAKLEIADFEKQNRELAMKVFQSETLTADEEKRLDYYIFSGIYGTNEHTVQNHLERFGKGSKLRYILHRIFPTMDAIKTWYPFYYKHKWLIPVLWVYRPIHGLLKNKNVLKHELEYLRQNKAKEN